MVKHEFNVIFKFDLEMVWDIENKTKRRALTNVYFIHVIRMTSYVSTYTNKDKDERLTTSGI